MIGIALGLLHLRLRTPIPSERDEEVKPWFFDYSLAALVALGLLGYLIFALLHPERF